jgi:hypothetical protein
MNAEVFIFIFGCVVTLIVASTITVLLWAQVTGRE